MKNALIVFAKYPEPGFVKTKLSKDIGNYKAYLVYKKLLTDIIDTHKNNTNYCLVVCFNPEEKKDQFKKLFKNVTIIPQVGENMGERLKKTFKEQLDKYKNVIVIGSDVPNINTDLINKAFQNLENYDVVIGPANDGGYYLIGMKKNNDIFDRISWGNEKVFQQTLKNIKNKKLTVAALESKHDIDNLNDLMMFEKEFKDIL